MDNIKEREKINKHKTEASLSISTIDVAWSKPEDHHIHEGSHKEDSISDLEEMVLI